MNLNPRMQRSCRLLLAILTVFTMVFSTAAPLAADQLEELIGDAGSAYRSGDLKRTLELLSRAITGVQNRLSAALADFLPGDTEGWDRGEPEFSEFSSDTGGLVVFGNLFSATVSYVRSEGEGGVTVTLTNQPELTGIARANLQLLENPFFRERAAEEAGATGELVEPYSIEALKGMKQWREAGSAGEISLFVGEVLLQAEGRGLENIAELEAILATADLGGLAAFAGGTPAP